MYDTVRHVFPRELDTHIEDIVRKMCDAFDANGDIENHPIPSPIFERYMKSFLEVFDIAITKRPTMKTSEVIHAILTEYFHASGHTMSTFFCVGSPIFCVGTRDMSPIVGGNCGKVGDDEEIPTKKTNAKKGKRCEKCQDRFAHYGTALEKKRIWCRACSQTMVDVCVIRV